MHSNNESTYQNFRRWLRYSREHVDTFRWEIPKQTRANALSITPAGMYQHLIIVLIKDDQISFLETEKSRTIH